MTKIMESLTRISFSSTTGITREVSTATSIVLMFLWLASRSVRGSAVPVSAPRINIEQNSVGNRQDLEIEETKRQMLNVLGIDELPKPRQGIVPHQYMMHIYQKMSSRKSGYKGVNTIRGFVDVGEWSIHVFCFSFLIPRSFSRHFVFAVFILSVRDQKSCGPFNKYAYFSVLGDVDSSSTAKFHQIYSFNISALPISEKIVSAELRLLRLSSQREWKYAWAHGTRYRAKLYYRKSVNHLWNGRLYTHAESVLLGYVLFDIREKGEEWKVFNVMKALRTWQNGTSLVRNFELQVESVQSGYLMPCYAFGLAEHGRPHYKRALLVSYTDDGRVRIPDDPPKKRRRSSKKSKKGNSRDDKKGAKEKRRMKRDARRRRRRKQLCSRKQLYVDFSLLGWSNWIIAPRGYNAYFCQGICKFPIPEHLKPTNHAMVQTTVHNVEKYRVPPACCVPHELSGLSMLFIDKGDSVVYKKYDKMVVESCGCK